MRKGSISVAAVAFTLAMTALSGPASATSTSTAIAICVSRGPDCSIANKDGQYEICVNNSGGQECVNCPHLMESDQTCSVARTGPDGTRETSGVVTLLAGERQLPEKSKSDCPEPTKKQ